MARGRLRKTFEYTADSHDEDDISHLDEEHQERLIKELQQQDTDNSDLYRKMFLIVPLLAGFFAVITLFTSSTARSRLVALLSVSSFVCTAYILHFIPVAKPGGKGKKPVYQIEAEKSPIDQYLPYLNAALAGLIMISAIGRWKKGASEDAGKEALPAIIFGLTMVVRHQLIPLDMDELQRARYEFKGA